VTLRRGLLADRRVAMAGDGSVAAAASEALQDLGAQVHVLSAGALADEEDATTWARERAPLHVLVVDAGATFGIGGPDGLRLALEQAWRTTHAVATGALIDPGAGGRLLLIAPPPDAGPQAGAARAGLENLARTLSVEWARYAITAVAITPGAGTADADVTQLVCFLASPAGGYFSGCRFDLGSVTAARS
jgi:NAD(P)-dependent dehydrogenase (short-subunit alcohol dehydrogenase family)